MSTADFTYNFTNPAACNICGSTEYRILGRRLKGSQGRNPRKKTGAATTIVSCRICGLIYCFPMPLPANIQDHYGLPPEEYWDEKKLGADYMLHQPELERLKKVISFREGMRSLDIGAGRGDYMKACSSAGFEAWGLEPSEPFYRRLIDKVGIPAERLQLGRVEEIDFPAEHFDYISLVAVLEHIPDPSLAITRAMQWLKPGGIMCIEVPSSDWLMAKLFDFYYKLRRMDYTTHLSPMHPPFHLYEFSLESFRQHARIHGYSIHSYRFYECETFMPRWLDKPLKWWMRRTEGGMDLYIWLKKVTGDG